MILLGLPPLLYTALALTVGRDRVWETLFGRPAIPPVDFATLDPPDRPNHVLVCPAGLCRAADAESPVFAAPVEAQRAAWLRLLDRAGAVRLDGRDGHRDGHREGQLPAGQWEVEVRTPWLRFPDRVTIRPLAVEGGRSTVAIYSRSLYGRSDFGTNRNRVEGWLGALERDLGRTAGHGAGHGVDRPEASEGDGEWSG